MSPPPADTHGSSGEARAWGWVAHLRSGGTTPWSHWRDGAPPAEQAGRFLPGAQQLELLRRLNRVGRPSAALAARVIGASAPGRGLPDLGLVDVLPPSRFGSPPVDPADLGPEELVRVATALLAEDVVVAGDPSRVRRARLLRKRYRLLGDPELARPVRSALTADGRPPGGPSPTVVVLGSSLDRMLVHDWTARAFGAGVRPWADHLAGVRRRTTLPGRIDLAATAQAWAGRVGSGRVHVVLDDPPLAARLVGRRRPVPAAPELSADAIELARRTAPVVGTLVPPGQRSRLMWYRLRPVLASYSGPALLVPPRHSAWLSERTADLRRRLAGGGYAVHGSLPQPSVGPGVTGPDDEGVLGLAMRILLGPPIGTPDAEAATPDTGAGASAWERGEDR